MINSYTPLSAVLFLFLGIFLMLAGTRALSVAHSDSSAGVFMPVGCIMLGVGTTLTVFTAFFGFNQLIEAPLAFFGWAKDFITE